MSAFSLTVTLKVISNEFETQVSFLTGFQPNIWRIIVCQRKWICFLILWYSIYRNVTKVFVFDWRYQSSCARTYRFFLLITKLTLATHSMLWPKTEFNNRIYFYENHNCQCSFAISFFFVYVCLECLSSI